MITQCLQTYWGLHNQQLFVASLLWTTIGLLLFTFDRVSLYPILVSVHDVAEGNLVSLTPRPLATVFQVLGLQVQSVTSGVYSARDGPRALCILNEQPTSWATPPAHTVLICRAEDIEAVRYISNWGKWTRIENMSLLFTMVWPSLQRQVDVIFDVLPMLASHRAHKTVVVDRSLCCFTGKTPTASEHEVKHLGRYVGVNSTFPDSFPRNRSPAKGIKHSVHIFLLELRVFSSKRPHFGVHPSHRVHVLSWPQFFQHKSNLEASYSSRWPESECVCLPLPTGVNASEGVGLCWMTATCHLCAYNSKM